MTQTPFDYQLRDEAVHRPDLVLFADAPHRLAALRDLAVSVGFRVQVASLGSLDEAAGVPLADVVLVDCLAVGAAELAALALLDQRVAQGRGHLIVATSFDGLEAAFGCLDQSGAQLLVDPEDADLVIALGRARAMAPRGRVRELGEEDRLLLVRLAEQVAEIAARLDRLDRDPPKVSAPAFAFHGVGAEDEPLVRKSRVPLPDPRMVRRVLRQRRLRDQFFDAGLFADPAWDMLLDLTAAEGERKRVSITSLCIAASVPPTTALRWIGQLVDAGLFCRVEDDADRRRAFIELSDRASEAMALYFAALDGKTKLPV